MGELIKDNFSDVEVIYTRKTDVFIPLYERGNIANKAGADLFFSIHVNAARSSAAAGTETFVMGVDKAGRNLDICLLYTSLFVLNASATSGLKIPRSRKSEKASASRTSAHL